MTRGCSSTGRIRGRGQGISVTPSSSSPSSSALPSPLAPPPTVVSPSTVVPVSTGSPSDLPISSPSDSTVPPTSSSVEGSSIGPDLPIVHVEDGRIYPEGYTWKNIPNEYKESYFEEFKDRISGIFPFLSSSLNHMASSLPGRNHLVMNILLNEMMHTKSLMNPHPSALPPCRPWIA
nr:uncharacterized protein LOC109149905 [Ipomoea trifida]